MTTSYQRRRDPQPLSQGWEIAVAAVGAVALALALAALAGLGAASALFGHGWVWPHGTPTIGHVLGGLLTGHPRRGLTPAQLDVVASPTAVYGCIAGCEAVVMTLTIGAGWLIARYRRPNDARSGMASRSEADRVLGISQLRGAKEIIRPDLYGSAPRYHETGATRWRRPQGRRMRTRRGRNGLAGREAADADRQPDPRNSPAAGETS